jgi:hypothetical protein
LSPGVWVGRDAHPHYSMVATGVPAWCHGCAKFIRAELDSRVRGNDRNVRAGLALLGGKGAVPRNAGFPPFIKGGKGGF